MLKIQLCIYVFWKSSRISLDMQLQSFSCTFSLGIINTTVKVFFFHSCIVHLDTIKVFYLPTDAQENCFKKNIKIYIKTAPTCFRAITIIRECIIWAC